MGHFSTTAAYAKTMCPSRAAMSWSLSGQCSARTPLHDHTQNPDKVFLTSVPRTCSIVKAVKKPPWFHRRGRVVESGFVYRHGRERERLAESEEIKEVRETTTKTAKGRGHMRCVAAILHITGSVLLCVKPAKPRFATRALVISRSEEVEEPRSSEGSAKRSAQV